MKHRYDLLLFDLDGTIMDTSEGIILALKHAIKKHNLKMLDDEALFTFIGPPVKTSFMRYYSDLGEKMADEYLETFREKYNGGDYLKAKTYSGIEKLFDYAVKNNIKVSVATYKLEYSAKRLLTHYGIDKFTSVIYGADYDGKLTKSDIIEKCIEDSNVKDRKRVLMIGDTLHDSFGAKKSNVDFLPVTYGFGFRSKDDVKDIDCIGVAECIEDIYKYI